MTRLKRLLKRLRGDYMIQDRFDATSTTMQQLLLLQGKQLANRVAAMGPTASMHDTEFSVFSQFGDDGIIQWLIHCIPDLPRTFVEFGVEDYTQANTRFLFLNNGWSGLVLDGSEENMQKVASDSRAGFLGLRSEAAFVTAENINDLLLRHSFEGDIGLLHIDIDGNDYWVWRSIEAVSPAIVIMEWNSVFGAERAITVPYDPQYVRAHPPSPKSLCCGASLLALCDLAESKGYSFIGSNSAGNNAYFVRDDLNHGLKRLSASEGYVESLFVEASDSDGKPLRGSERIEAIRGMSVFNTRTGELEAV